MFNSLLEKAKDLYNDVFGKDSVASMQEKIAACQELIKAQHSVIENEKVCKDSILRALKEYKITILDLAEIMDIAGKDMNIPCPCEDILRTLDGWVVDDERCIKFGTQRLMERLGDDKGTVIALEVLYLSKEAYLKSKREAYCKKEQEIETKKESADVCQHMCSWCTDVEKCTGALDEWSTGMTAAGNICYMQHEQETYQCPGCEKGIINPTFNGTVACDKCAYEVNYNYFKTHKESIYNKEEK